MQKCGLKGTYRPAHTIAFSMRRVALCHDISVVVNHTYICGIILL